MSQKYGFNSANEYVVLTKDKNIFIATLYFLISQWK